MKPPKGYKQTELGILPDNWKVVRLGEVCEIFDGTHQTPKYTKAGIPFFSVENITNNDFINTKFISKEEHEKLTKNNKLKKGDILMTRIGTLGICKVIDWDIEASYYVSLSLLRTKKCLFNIFLFQYSNCFNFRKEIDKNSLLLAIPPKINLGDIFNLKIPLPPLKEQEKIAEILNAADLELLSYEKLIALKEKYKKSLMQKLLTPKIRFKEFKEQWKMVKLGEVCEYQNGDSNEQYIIENGQYFLITLNSIDINGRLKKEHKRVNEGQPYLRKNDIVMILSDIAHGFLLGLTAVIKENDKYILNQRVGLLRPIKQVNSMFLSYVINLKQSYFKKHGQGSSQLNLSKDDILKFSIYIPLDIKEQNKIIEVLFRTDKEIELLNKYLELLKKQKHALMQRLLSGKVRVKGT